MKRFLFSVAVLLVGTLAFAIPNEKVLSSFSTAFPKAQEISWYENGSNFEVHFLLGEVRCKLWYDSEGMLVKSHRYYPGNLLPPMILSSLQRKHSDKKIFGVTEVTSQDGLQYYIKMEDEKKWYDITSDAIGNLVLTRKFNKA